MHGIAARGKDQHMQSFADVSDTETTLAIIHTRVFKDHCRRPIQFRRLVEGQAPVTEIGSVFGGVVSDLHGHLLFPQQIVRARRIAECCASSPTRTSRARCGYDRSTGTLGTQSGTLVSSAEIGFAIRDSEIASIVNRAGEAGAVIVAIESTLPAGATLEVVGGQVLGSASIGAKTTTLVRITEAGLKRLRLSGADLDGNGAMNAAVKPVTRRARRSPGRYRRER